MDYYKIFDKLKSINQSIKGGCGEQNPDGINRKQRKKYT